MQASGELSTMQRRTWLFSTGTTKLRSFVGPKIAPQVSWIVSRQHEEAAVAGAALMEISQVEHAVVDEAEQEKAGRRRRRLTVAGIGASAGGLDALRTLFEGPFSEDTLGPLIAAERALVDSGVEELLPKMRGEAEKRLRGRRRGPLPRDHGRHGHEPSTGGRRR